MSSLIPLQEAVLNAYEAACSLVPLTLRHHVILIGGAGSIAQGMHDRKTEDANILVNTEALAILEDAVENRVRCFHRDTDGTIKWDQYDADGFAFSVKVEFILIGRLFAPRLPEIIPFRNGWVALLPWLVLFRATTLVNRGDEIDDFDFVRLLPMMCRVRLKLPHLEEDQMDRSY
jgi:hypothetical protein